METQKKILILKSSQDSFENYYNERMKRKNIDISPVYRYNTGLLRKISVLWIQYFHFPIKGIWYGTWTKYIEEYDQIIVFDRILGFDILSYIHRKNPKARIIFWYWNIAKKMIPDKYRKYCEVWSFDEKDCLKYNFRKNIQFYFEQSQLSTRNESTIDAFFVGRDKGRYKQIKYLYDFLLSQNLKVDFRIVDSVHNSELCINKPMNYEEIIRLIKNSKCIVEFTQQEQTGLSARALEALFFHKKLITNNINMQNEKMYSPDNVFILGKDSMDKLKEFINKPYHNCNENMEREYSYDTWVKNFE